QTSIKYKKIRTSSKQVVYQALNTGTIKIRNEDGTIGEKVINQEHFYSDKNGTETFGNGIELEKDYSAKNYYIESADFSTWVQNNLADIVISDMQVGYEYDDTLNIAQNKAKSLKLLEFYKVDGNSSKKIFNLNNNNPEDPDSVFVKHKNQVIKQALISNLNQAITSYSRNSEGEYSLPILTETDWNNVLGNISIITFVQDIPIGMKYYNNYAIATSTQNKEYVNPDEIYLSKKGDNYYHLPECSELSDDSGIIGYRNIDYVVKSYEKEEDIEYYYKHSDIAKEACYYCLVQRDLYSSEGLSEQVINEHDKAYRIALARERCRNISEINSDDELSLQIAVTLNENYGEEPSKTTIYVPYQGQYGDLPEPTRRGHDFKGRFKDPEDSSSHNRVVKNTIVNRFDHELYAHWTTMKYWVTFDTNEGSYVEPIELAYGSLYGELPTPTKAGYTFKGWYTAESGGTEITAGTEVTIASNHTLYAHWTANTYQVELDANGGKFSNGNEKEYVDNTYLVAYSLSAETPTKTGYNFVGWYTAKSGGTRVFAGDQVVNPEPHTLYAHWESNKFTVTLYANGGKFSNGEAGIDIEVTYLELYPGTLSLQIPTREGYSFNGWKKEDGTQVIAGQQVTTLDSVLYADWTTNTCTVTYDACGGTITTGESTKTFTKGTSYVHPTPEKEGYEFDGWYTDQFGGNEVEYGALVSTTGELKLYAHWKAVYTVTYIAEGGANVPGAQEFQEGSSITLSSQHPTRDGYQFSGWTYNSSKYYPGETHTFGNSVTLYAIWNEVDVSGIEITNLSNNSWVKRGDTLYLSAKVYPENTLYRDVTWGTSNDSVASIDSYGWLTLKETGLVTITAKAGGVTTTVDIYVYNVFLKAGETLTTYKYSDIPEERPTTYYKAETGGMYIIAEQYYNSYYRIVNRNNNCIIKNHHNDSIYFDLNKEQLYGTIEVY
ncbi:MAG: InlB B-repeat-containing protein, partial [Clostridia bacterium]|nr:InlB B-repeat-containing protein [Clostridia bacterium]